MHHSVLFDAKVSQYDENLKANVLTQKPNKQFFLSTENFEKGLTVPYVCGLRATPTKHSPSPFWFLCDVALRYTFCPPLCFYYCMTKIFAVFLVEVDTAYICVQCSSALLIQYPLPRIIVLITNSPFKGC